MEAIKLFGVFSVFVVFLFSDISCHGGHDAEDNSTEKNCPNYGVFVDINNMNAVAKAQRQLVYLAWKSNFIACPSELSKELEILLKQLVNSDSDNFRNVALVHSITMTSYLTTLSNDRDLCLFTKLINATLALDEGKNVTNVAEYLQEFSSSYKDTEELNTRVSLFVAGCKYTPPVKPPCPTCYDKGLTYRIKDMWKLRGNLFPCNIRDLVFKMYNSANEIDRYHALLVTASLSTVVREVFLKPSSFIGTALEKMKIFTTTEIDLCCCKPRRLRLQQVAEEVNTVVKKRIVNIIKEKYTECEQ